MDIVLISSLVHPSLPDWVKVGALVIVLVPEQPSLEQGWSLSSLTSNTVTWMTFSWNVEEEETGKERAAEAYLSTRFEEVKCVPNENMGYMCSSCTHSCCSSFVHKVVA